MRRKGTKAITVRGIPPDVARVIRRDADETGESVNRVVIRLLEDGAGVGKKQKTVLHHDLDRLIGVWSREEAKSFDRALNDQRRIDPELWK
jgi:hypothetical protein